MCRGCSQFLSYVIICSLNVNTKQFLKLHKEPLRKTLPYWWHWILAKGTHWREEAQRFIQTNLLTLRFIRQDKIGIFPDHVPTCKLSLSMNNVPNKVTNLGLNCTHPIEWRRISCSHESHIMTKMKNIYQGLREYLSCCSNNPHERKRYGGKTQCQESIHGNDTLTLTLHSPHKEHTIGRNFIMSYIFIIGIKEFKNTIKVQ